MEISFSPEEQATFESEAIIYSIIRTLEFVEKSYLNEKIEDEEYHSHCRRLINQFKTVSQSLTSRFLGLEPFMQKYRIDGICPLAFQRLKLGITATEMSSSSSSESDTTAVIKTVQSFISTSDAIHMNITSAGELYPFIQKLISNINKVRGIPSSYSGLLKMEEWLTILNGMKAYDELDEDQLKQLDFDVDKAFREFKTIKQT